jgi:hypothetical protein
MSGHTSNAASEGCHSIAQLIMSDLQTSIGDESTDDILEMIVCLRDGKEAVEQLKARYPEEAKNVALDIKTKLGSRVASGTATSTLKPALSSILNRNRMSLCLLRALLPRVMTATEARRGLILLRIKCSCSAHAYNRGSSRGWTPDLPEIGDPTPTPDLPGIGGPPPRPPPICRNRGSTPTPGSNRGFRALRGGPGRVQSLQCQGRPIRGQPEAPAALARVRCGHCASPGRGDSEGARGGAGPRRRPAPGQGPSPPARARAVQSLNFKIPFLPGVRSSGL